MSEEEKTPTARARSHSRSEDNSGEQGWVRTERGDNSSSGGDEIAGVANDLVDEGKMTGADQCLDEEERTVAWLSLRKQAAESRCRELEKELADARDAATKQDTRFVIRHTSIGYSSAAYGVFFSVSVV